jgi:hypothetical protein
MANEGHLYIMSSATPVHSFDLWGPLVDTDKLGQEMIRVYRQVASGQGLEQGTIEKIASDYDALLKNDPVAIKNKKTIVPALQGPAEASGLVDYRAGFNQDCIDAIAQILDAGERVIIYTTKPSPWVKANLPENVAARMGEVYSTGPEGKTSQDFARVIMAEYGTLVDGRCGQVVSHTADQLPELVAALETGMFHKQGLVYVARDDSNTELAVRSAGIGRFVRSLGEVSYPQLTEELRHYRWGKC